MRALLVREAAGAASRRRTAARRAAPVVAALTVVGVAAGAALAGGRGSRTHIAFGGQGTAVDPPYAKVTAVDPPYAKVTVRGRPGTLVRPSTGFVSDPVITWTEPDGQRWSVTADGLDAADLLAFADALDIDDDTARPGWTSAVPSTVSTLPEALGAPQKDTVPARPYWLRLDVPAAGVHVPPVTLTAIDVPRLLATFTHPQAGRVTFEADASRGPWQAEIRAGDRIRPLAGGVLAAERADEQGPGRSVLWSLPSGAKAVLSGSSGGDAVLALAASVEPVASTDPRLAGPVVEQPGVRPDGTPPP